MLTYYRKNKIKDIFKHNYKKFNINLEETYKNIYKFTLNDYEISFYNKNDIFFFDHNHVLIETHKDWISKKEKKFKTYQILELNEELKKIVRKLKNEKK